MTVQTLYERSSRNLQPSLTAALVPFRLRNISDISYGAIQYRSCRANSNIRSRNWPLLDRTSYSNSVPVPFDLIAMALLLKSCPTMGSLQHAHMAQSNDSTYLLIHTLPHRPSISFTRPSRPPVGKSGILHATLLTM